jgi:hypothetical protein
MSRYPVKSKEVYNRTFLDPLLVSYLEKWSGSHLSKLRKISPADSPFTRWRLEGIHNISYSNNTGNKLSLFHSAIRLPLQEFFPTTLLHVGTEMGVNDLVLDFKGENDIFERIDPEAYETYKDLPPSSFRSKEEKLIRIPYITILT